MKRSILFLLAGALLLTGCKKNTETLVTNSSSNSIANGQFVKYTIRKGNQYCDQNVFRSVSVRDLKFTARFDSSAIYQTKDPSNQYDINKLYGFSDNNADHHSYSARFGWRWSDNALRLFAYIYNEGSMSSKELGTIAIGSQANCEIKVDSSTYIFTLNGTSTSMPRLSTTTTGSGYQLYPYFGGDETAPHDINIWIRSGE